jgi:uncharacterized membrane protein
MIECPACKTWFNPRFRRCPKCETYEARLEDRLDYLAEAAEADLDRGATPAEVEAMLIAEGVAPLEACEIVSAKAKKVARAERSYGLVRLLGGAGLILLAAMIVLVGVLTLPSRLGRRLLLVGVLLGVAGAWPFGLGIYSVLTGREAR